MPSRKSKPAGRPERVAARGAGASRTAAAAAEGRGSRVAKRQQRQQRAPSRGAAARRFGVVGISVGEAGHEACAELVAELPPDFAMAVVVTPQSGGRPADDDLLPVLAGRSRMPVAAATDGLALAPGRVYVVPRGKLIGLAGGRFRSGADPGPGRPFLRADFFLRSLAGASGVGAVGVVLCGSELDGSVGLQEIKGAGGIAIAQDPKTAKQEGAPRSAITTGAVDLVLAPRDIARELVRLATQAARVGAVGPGTGAKARDGGVSAGDGHDSNGDGADPELPPLILGAMRDVTGRGEE